jgi:hypothetical protein
MLAQRSFSGSGNYEVLSMNYEIGKGSYMLVSPWKGGRGEDINNYEVCLPDEALAEAGTMSYSVLRTCIWCRVSFWGKL